MPVEKLLGEVFIIALYARFTSVFRAQISLICFKKSSRWNVPCVEENLKESIPKDYC